MPQARIVPAANRHCTLAFLGSVPDDRREAIAAVLAGAEGAGPVATAFTEVGGFPSLARPRVLWAGLADDDHNLAAVADGVRRGLASLGFEPEARPYTPHVTLARLRDPARVDPAAMPSLGREPFAIERLTLFESRLSPQGARYARVASIPLR